MFRLGLEPGPLDSGPPYHRTVLVVYLLLLLLLSDSHAMKKHAPRVKIGIPISEYVEVYPRIISQDLNGDQLAEGFYQNTEESVREKPLEPKGILDPFPTPNLSMVYATFKRSRALVLLFPRKIWM